MSDAVKDGRITERERFDLHVLVGIGERSGLGGICLPSARNALVRLGLIHAFDRPDPRSDLSAMRCGPSCHICREREERDAPREALLASFDEDGARAVAVGHARRTVPLTNDALPGLSYPELQCLAAADTGRHENRYIQCALYGGHKGPHLFE